MELRSAAVVDVLYREPALTAAAAAFTGLDSPVFFTRSSATLMSFVKGWRVRGALTGFEEIVEIVLSGVNPGGWLTG